MVDQPTSPPPPRKRKSGKLTLPDTGPGMNKLAPNENEIDGKGKEVGPDIPVKEDPGGPKDEPDADILARIRKRLQKCVSADSDQRKAEVEDRKFKKGDQWPADIAAQRATDRRPCLTNSRMKTFVHQVTNPARENRPQINISPIGEKADKHGAEIYEGLIRRTENDSRADIAYDTALDDAVTSGRGYIRLLTEWKSPKSFMQVPVIKRVRNPFTIYLDNDAIEPDGSDAKFGFVSEMIPPHQFEQDYPDAVPMSFDVGGAGESFKAWNTKEGIRVVEYYEIVEKVRDLVALSNGYTGWRDELPKSVENSIKTGEIRILQERRSPEPTVMYYKATAMEILERKPWIGQWIPIIQVIGDEIDVEGKVTYAGIIRDAKDSQRMMNYWDTFLTENVALAPKTHYIMEEGQLEGHMDEWKTIHTRPRGAVTYKGTAVDGHPAPPPQRVPPPDVPAGIMAALQQSQQNMMATTGIRFDASSQERMFDESGKALRELSRRTDIGAFHYYDNFRRSLEFLGRQLVDIFPKLFTERQVITILGLDDKAENVTIDPMMGGSYKEVQGEKGISKYFNPGWAEWGVKVDVGPSYATKRQESAESMMEFVKALPNTAALVMDLIAAQMDWPGADLIAARLAKAIPANLLTADLKDIPPQIQALIQNLEEQTKQLHAQLQQAMQALQDKAADREIAMAKISADFEAKILGIVAKTEEQAKKIALDQAKFVAEKLIEEMRAAADRNHEIGMAALDMANKEQPKDTPKDADGTDE